MTRPILLFGATSILGYNLARQFPERVEAYATPSEALALFERRPPDIVIYGHAVCDVPKCEGSPEWAQRINVGHVRQV